MRLLIVALLLCISFPVFSQGFDDLPKPRKIARPYRTEYRQLLKDAKSKLKTNDGWDIVLDPIEIIPIARYSIAPLDNNNWGNKLLLPPDVWTELRSRATGRVVIKIGDTGEAQHTDLKRGLLTGANYTTDSERYDGHGHSTHVGGIIGANGFGLADPLFDKGLAQIKFCKVLSNSGSGSFTWIANMITAEDADNRQLIANGTRVVVNFSLGGGTAKVDAIETALQGSTALGVVYCIAAGNSGGPVNYPGNSIYATGVSSLDENLLISSFSSRGPEVEQTAPGRGIFSTYLNNGYATLSGTSMATPFMTALTAIAMSVYPDKLTNQATVDAYFKKISTDLGTPGKDDLYGWGLAYVRAILDRSPDDTTPPTPCSITKVEFLETPTKCNDNGTSTPTDDYFTQSVRVGFKNVPKTGVLQFVAGDQIGSYSVPVASLVDSAYTFNNVKFKADGTQTDITLNFSAAPGCSATKTGPAVQSCSTTPPDTTPVRPVRTLTFPVDGPFTIVWMTTGSALSGMTLEEPIIFTLPNVGTEAATQTLKIRSIEAAVLSTTSANVEYKKFKSNLSWFFKNRGLGLPPKSDFADATYWTAYFVDLLLDIQSPMKQDIIITKIVGEDSTGELVVYYQKDLKDWPHKK